MALYYKVLSLDGTPCHGGSGKWNLPDEDKPGKWMPEITDIKVCESGYHVVNRKQLLLWLGPIIYECEVSGDGQEDIEKSIFPRVRLVRKLNTWNERTARLFAADCAERVLPIFEKAYPEDRRPRIAVECARKFANGDCTSNDLQNAASAAVESKWAVTWAATECIAVAIAASWAATECNGLTWAIEAVMEATWAVESATRWNSRRDGRTEAIAEREWQIDRLWEYLDGRVM